MLFKINFTCNDEQKAHEARIAISVLTERLSKIYTAQYRALKILGEERVCNYTKKDWVSGNTANHAQQIRDLKYKAQPLVEKLGEPGTDIVLDIVERHPELVDVPISNIQVDTACPINGHKKEVLVDFKTALGSKMFKGRTEITVQVPEGFMTRFVDPVTRIEYFRDELGFWEKLRGKKREVSRSTSTYVYHQEQVLEAWADAGYPLNWEV